MSHTMTMVIRASVSSLMSLTPVMTKTDLSTTTKVTLMKIIPPMGIEKFFENTLELTTWVNLVTVQKLMWHSAIEGQVDEGG